MQIHAIIDALYKLQMKRFISAIDFLKIVKCHLQVVAVFFKEVLRVIEQVQADAYITTIHMP